MDFNEYQEKALKSATYYKLGNNLIYPAMGLVGEAGEFADKIKKLWRNTGVPLLNYYDLNAEQIMELVKEAGDVQWYLAAIAKELRLPLGLFADTNIEKLTDRLNRGVIKSQGDNR